MFTLGCVLRHGQFLIFSVDDDADPLALILCLVHLHTHFGIGTHPLHLLPKRRENVHVTVFVGKMNWNHIRLVLIRAAQPAQRSMLKNRLAFLCCHFVDFHDGFLQAYDGPRALLTISCASRMITFRCDARTSSAERSAGEYRACVSFPMYRGPVIPCILR